MTQSQTCRPCDDQRQRSVEVAGSRLAPGVAHLIRLDQHGSAPAQDHWASANRPPARCSGCCLLGSALRQDDRGVFRHWALEGIRIRVQEDDGYGSGLNALVGSRTSLVQVGEQHVGRAHLAVIGRISVVGAGPRGMHAYVTTMDPIANKRIDLLPGGVASWHWFLSSVHTRHDMCAGRLWQFCAYTPSL